MPEIFTPGTLVENRNRLWRVEDQKDNTIQVSSLDGSDDGRHEFFLPFEDVSRADLDYPDPDELGELPLQRLLIQSHRLSMLHGSEPLLSLQQSRAIPTTFQLVPVVMALEMPRVRLLLADDVGLGKTIEAGLIVTELMARNRIDRILFLTPANLREQWREAFDYFFHLDVPIISRRHKRMLDSKLPPGANHWEYFDRLIASHSYAKQSHIKPQILAQEWDMVIVDEAHKLAKPHQSSPHQSVNKIAWDFGQEIAEHVPNLLLLTATPHNGYRDSFASLLHLLDPTRQLEMVSGPLHDPVIDRERARRHVCQRRRRDVEEAFRETGEENPFPDRDQSEITLGLNQKEIKAIEQVNRLGDLITSSAGKQQQRREILARWTQMHFHKRALSSPASLRASLENRLEVLAEAREEEETETDTGVDVDTAQQSTMDEDLGDELTDEEAAFRLDRTVTSEQSYWDKERTQVQQALEAARKIDPADDNKLTYLAETLIPDWFEASSPRAIVFTRFKDTLDYIADNIREFSPIDYEIVTVYGDLSEVQRRERFEEFSSTEPALMIATDCISEGVNLQQACSQLVHYELPWNPNRLEQRNGRVDRFGQRADEVRIRTLVMEDTLDAKILETLVEKAARIQEDYGFSPPYFSDSAAIFDVMEQQGVANELRSEKQMRLPFYNQDADVVDPYQEETLDKIQQDSFYGQEDVDLSDVKERLQETEKRVGTHDQIREFVRLALSHLGGSFREDTDEVYHIKLSNPRLEVSGLPTDFRATFEPHIGMQQNDIEVLDLGHSLVRRLIDLMKQRTFQHGEKYGRTAYKVHSEVPETTALLWILARFVVNTEPTSVVEELLTVTIALYSDKPAARDDSLWELESEENMPPEDVKEDLRFLFNGHDLLHDDINNVVEQRHDELIRQREEFKQRLQREGHSLKWMRGMTDIDTVSNDILAVTMMYPR